jgi:hypothetical protein
MVGHGVRVSGLAFSGADFLFDFLEPGRDLPPCAVVLNDPMGAKFGWI